MAYLEICREVCRLVNYGLQKNLISKTDVVYATNRILDKLQLADFVPEQVTENLRYPADILQKLCDYAVEKGMILDTGESRDQYDTELMNCMMPRPSEVEHAFYSLYEQDKQAATDYYYGLSKHSNYIRMDRVEKDRMWKTGTLYGDMIITVNLAKPEKDPRDIAAARNAVQSGYPKCVLCRENEGFAGGPNQAARANHRLVPLKLSGEQWYLQYSPYVYYNEHCILLNKIHKPMSISRESIYRLMEFVTFIPHYFIGSNADLPIVGGSILSHDHFQGGNYEFPMAKAPLREAVCFPGYEEIEAGIVNWPMSTLRLIGTVPERLTELAGLILDAWRGYSDEEADVFAFSGKTPHNTITPIARRRNERYELDLVLRNNRTSKEHPLGIFHPHGEYHHIKRENIGLIEVMGLAILPARLIKEMAQMKTALLKPECAREILNHQEMEKHALWYERLKDLQITEENAQQVIQASIGEIFMHILENAGVFKDTPAGNAAFRKFCSTVL